MQKYTDVTKVRIFLKTIHIFNNYYFLARIISSQRIYVIVRKKLEIPKNLILLVEN